MFELGFAPFLELLEGLVFGQAKGVKALREGGGLAGLQFDLSQVHADG